MLIPEGCTEACFAMPECAVCHLRKPPRGRSVPLEAANGYCGYDCPGYRQPPYSGHLWPSEAIMDTDEAAQRAEDKGDKP